LNVSMLPLADAYSQSVCRTTAFCQSLTTGKSHDSPTDRLCHRSREKSRVADGEFSVFSVQFSDRAIAGKVCALIEEIEMNH